MVGRGFRDRYPAPPLAAAQMGSGSESPGPRRRRQHRLTQADFSVVIRLHGPPFSEWPTIRPEIQKKLPSGPMEEKITITGQTWRTLPLRVSDLESASLAGYCRAYAVQSVHAPLNDRFEFSYRRAGITIGRICPLSVKRADTRKHCGVREDRCRRPVNCLLRQPTSILETGAVRRVTTGLTGLAQSASAVPSSRSGRCYRRLNSACSGCVSHFHRPKPEDSAFRSRVLNPPKHRQSICPTAESPGSRYHDICRSAGCSAARDSPQGPCSCPGSQPSHGTSRRA